MHEPVLVASFSPAQPRPRQDAPFSQAAMAKIYMLPPSSLVSRLAEPNNDRVMRFIRRWSSDATNSIHYTPHAPLIWMLAPFT